MTHTAQHRQPGEFHPGRGLLVAILAPVWLVVASPWLVGQAVYDRLRSVLAAWMAGAMVLALEVLIGIYVGGWATWLAAGAMGTAAILYTIKHSR